MMNSLDDLVDLLGLEQLDEDLYRGRSEDPGWRQLYGGHVLAQALAAEYLTGGYLERQLPKIIQLYAPRQLAMLDSLARHLPEDFTWSRPEGGMFVWVEGPKGFDAVELQRRVIERGVAFVPGRYFFVNQEIGAGTLRMNFTAADPDTIEHAVGIIADGIADLLAETR